MKIIRDPLYIAEDYRLNDALIEFENNNLQNNLSKIKQSAVIALVGDYGTGKSTALYGVQKNDDDQSHLWLQFDAWRYPERKGLWDGLIIEIAKQLGKGKKAARQIDGNKSLLGKWGGIVSETFSLFGDVLPKSEINKIEANPVAIGKAVKITQKAEEVFGRSPAKRVYELERILADILVSVGESTIYLVVEDVDRSGSDGLNFLETINFFIKNNEQLKNSGKTILVIAPIAKRNYEEFIDSYYKCIDVAFIFSPTIKDAKSFIRQVFTDEALGGEGHPYLANIEFFLAGLFENTSYSMNIRKLKAVIRKTDIAYEVMNEKYENVDWRAVFVIEAMKSIYTSNSNDTSLFDASVTGDSELSGANIFTGLLMTIHAPDQPMYIYKYSNSRLREDRRFNVNIQSYKFSKYDAKAHGEVSVWIGFDDHHRQRGFIAEYYKK